MTPANRENLAQDVDQGMNECEADVAATHVMTTAANRGGAIIREVFAHDRDAPPKESIASPRAVLALIACGLVLGHHTG